MEGVPVGYNWSITAALTARAGGARVRLREAFEDNDNTSKINNENDNDIIHPARLTRKLPCSCYCDSSDHRKSQTRRPNPSSAECWQAAASHTSYLPVSGFAKRLSTRSVHPRVAPDQAPENVTMRCCSVCVCNSFRRASRSSRLRLLIAASSKSQATTHALQPRLCPSRARGDLSSHWPLVQLRLLPSSTSRSQRPQWGQYNALRLRQQ